MRTIRVILTTICYAVAALVGSVAFVLAYLGYSFIELGAAVAGGIIEIHVEEEDEDLDIPNE